MGAVTAEASHRGWIVEHAREFRVEPAPDVNMDQVHGGGAGKAAILGGIALDLLVLALFSRDGRGARWLRSDARIARWLRGA